jgi:hypothetical protein
MKRNQTRTGKIAALPESIRNELNRRLLDGQLSPQILPWLNADKTVLLILDERFDGDKITPQNLSEWRNGGFKDWLKSSERIAHTKQLASYAADLARQNGGRLAEGAQAIAGGRILALLEASGGNLPAQELSELINCLTSLRMTEINQAKVDQGALKLQQRDREFKLEREKFELMVCKKALDAGLQSKRDEIAASNLSNEAKIVALRQIYFADVDALEKSGEVKIPK